MAAERSELLRTFALANEFKEGDLLVGGTRDESVRASARAELGALELGRLSTTALVEDGVSDALASSLDRRLAAEISSLTVGKLKGILLGEGGAEWMQRYREGLSSESIAAVVKLMTNDELSAVARKVFNPLPGEGVGLGSPRHFGSRLQPNSPGDDEEEILFSVLEGLTYGCGDVLLGINPAGDDVETIVRLEELLRSIVERLKLPMRYCVLSDIVKQSSARERVKVDVGFQSLAGTSKALGGMVGLDVEGVLDLSRGFDGLYFETGQGSEVTNGAAEGVDMLTLEARSYGVARHIQKRTGAWMIVNDVAGFIGPEVFRTGEQLLRACLEDTVMAKLHGLTMGLDVCSTFHMGIEPAELKQLTAQIVEHAAPAYLMAVAGNADPMLGYLTTSFREHPHLRRQTGKHISSPMQSRLNELGVMDARGLPRADAESTVSLYAVYMKAGGDTRSHETLREEASKKIGTLAARGLDLGLGHAGDYDAPPAVESRLETIYKHARRALYSALDDGVLREVGPQHLRVRTEAQDREQYLSDPPAGERLRAEDSSRVAALYGARRPQVQLVLSDGLNADALNENLRAILPRLRRELTGAGLHVGETDIVVTNGRVRAGYHVGELLGVDLVLHLIGERPGTGLNTLSAYLTYGRDPAGRLRWSPGLDHAHTTAVCGIHPKGKRPDAAVEEMAACVTRMFEERRSGVALGSRFRIR
ncbi:MAG TPA: ethanolamine ammonia-lyase subunit EutB [Pyrinomonadaceae bacterium]|jgi:ethanolamine ammonia-lyase large subunit|nr:ethanolamine ammonia-lyase subunit EutB [Pyrinomonadaceae bacterium]